MTRVGGASSGIVSSSALPSGAATSNLQTAILNELELKANLTETQPVSAASLPLPTGASTSAAQEDQTTLLQGISGLVTTGYDYVSLSYTGDNLTGVIFKSGGAGGAIISTLTLSYTGDRLDTVTKT